jgi:L-lactate utilization protein LutC
MKENRRMSISSSAPHNKLLAGFHRKSKIMALQQHKVLLILVSLLFTFPNTTVAQQKDQGLSLSGSEQENVGTITLTVTDKYGRYVSGLSKDQITILDEKTPQEILGFE